MVTIEAGVKCDSLMVIIMVTYNHGDLVMSMAVVLAMVMVIAMASATAMLVLMVEVVFTASDAVLTCTVWASHSHT